MANQSFTNSLIKDKQYAALQLPPRAPTRNTSEPDFTEGCEILFQARNVLNTDENPSLSFLDDELVPAPPNTPNIEDFAHANDPTLKAKMKRLQANRMYAARYRLRKEANIQKLTRHIGCLQVEVSIIQSHLLYFESAYKKLIEENAQLKAYCNAATMLNAEKEAVNCALIQEIHRLKNQYY